MPIILSYNGCITFLKFLANDQLVGPAVETVSKNVVEAGPGNCPFELRHMFTQQKLQDKRYNSISYDV